MSVSDFSPSPSRLDSLDLLRGLDMLLIIGLDALIIVLAQIFPHTEWLSFTAKQMGHSHWQGATAYDFIFPIFVFISGISMSFSLRRFTYTPGLGIAKVWKRAAILVLLGMLINGTLSWDANMRIASVLGLIGLSCAIAGSAALLLKKPLAIGLFGIVILSTIAILQFSLGDFSATGSLNSLIDQTLLPGKLHGGTYDPEGLLCIISASALCLGGYLVGILLQNPLYSPAKKLLIILGIGIITLLTGWGLGDIYPIIKKLWTGSFVLLTMGVSCLLLTLFYFIVDICGLHRWGLPLRIVGMNALVAYLMYNLLNLQSLNLRIISGIASFFGSWQNLIIVLSFLSLQLGILFLMYKKRIFVKI